MTPPEKDVPAPVRVIDESERGPGFRLIRTFTARRLLGLAAPLILSQGVIAVMQFVDVGMLSSLGTDALAALAPSSIAITVLVYFGFGFHVAVNTMVAQSGGRKGSQASRVYAWQGVFLSLGYATFVASLWPTAPVVFELLGHGPEVVRLEVEYFRYSLVAVGASVTADALANYFIALKRPVVALAGTLISCGANIVFNYILIFGKLGFPTLGVKGAAIGTSAAACLQLGVYFFWFIRERTGENGPPTGGRPTVSLGAMRDLVRVGIPSGVQAALDVVTWGVLLVLFIGRYGKEHLAAAAIIIRYLMLCYMPVDGIGSALITQVGHSLGGGHIGDARRQARCAFHLAGRATVVGAALFFLFRHQIFAFFSDDPAVVEIGVRCAWVVVAFQLADVGNMIYGDALRGAGYTLWPLLINIVACVVIFIPGGLVAYHAAPRLGSAAIWFVDGVYALAQAVLLYLRWRGRKWERLTISREWR